MYVLTDWSANYPEVIGVFSSIRAAVRVERGEACDNPILVTAPPDIDLRQAMATPWRVAIMALPQGEYQPLEATVAEDEPFSQYIGWGRAPTDEVRWVEIIVQAGTADAAISAAQEIYTSWARAWRQATGDPLNLTPWPSGQFATGEPMPAISPSSSAA